MNYPELVKLAGHVGAVIVVVIIFVKHLEKRDTRAQETGKDARVEREQMAARYAELIEHNTTALQNLERTLRERPCISGNTKPKTRPRSRKKRA